MMRDEGDRTASTAASSSSRFGEQRNGAHTKHTDSEIVPRHEQRKLLCLSLNRVCVCFFFLLLPPDGTPSPQPAICCTASLDSSNIRRRSGFWALRDSSRAQVSGREISRSVLSIQVSDSQHVGPDRETSGVSIVRVWHSLIPESRRPAHFS